MKKNIFMISIIVIIDQILKLVILNTVGLSGKSATIIPHILQITYVENTGAAFGFFSARIILIGLDILIIYAILKIILNKKYKLEENIKLGLSLILAGGIGNLIDRIFRGYVIDYIDISNLFNFAVFNIADICIVIGVLLVFIMILIKTVKSQENINEKV